MVKVAVLMGRSVLVFLDGWLLSSYSYMVLSRRLQQGHRVFSWLSMLVFVASVVSCAVDAADVAKYKILWTW